MPRGLDPSFFILLFLYVHLALILDTHCILPSAPLENQSSLWLSSKFGSVLADPRGAVIFRLFVLCLARSAERVCSGLS